MPESNEREVELHTPDGFDAVRRTIEMLPGGCTLENREGRFFITGGDTSFAAWAAVKQGYVKREVP